MPNYYSERIHEGPEAIVVAMDIGATQSAASFAHFSPGSRPQGETVAYWPGQVHWSGAFKTPSMVSYSGGIVKACGAEAMHDFEEHEENVAYWFKLHLHPAPILMSNSSYSQEFEIPSLPTGITIERVYADLMRYLMENTRRFFEMTTANGTEIWARVRDTIVIVLATPGVWDIREQATLRKAAIMASLVTEENAGQLLQFVSQVEASVHYALSQDLGEWLKRKTVFAVIDCGGFTVDTTVYRCMSSSPLILKETCPGECVQAGGIIIDREVEKILRGRLKGSSFSDPEIIKLMIGAFEKELKPKFDGTMENYHFKFGVSGDNDPYLGIYEGRITLSNQELKPVFDAVIDNIVTGCLDTLISQKAEYVILAGGFAESPYVRRALSKPLDSHKMQIITAGDYTRKATAEGAVIAHIKQFVVARAAKATFGGCVRQLYDKSLHRERKHAIQIDVDGKKRVDGAFHAWVTKGTILQGTSAHKLSYHVASDATSTSKSELIRSLETIEMEIFAWEGGSIPVWCKDEHGVVLKGMRPLCTLNANLSSLAAGLQIKIGPRGKRFYRADYDVCVYFGGTQLRAKLQWRQGSVLRESQVKVMPMAKERPDKSMPFENLRIPDGDDLPSETTMAQGDMPASQMISPLSRLHASYSLGAPIWPPSAATNQTALILTPSSSIQRHPDPISTLKHPVRREISTSNSLPDILHEQNQSLGRKSVLGAHSSAGSSSQYYSFDSSSVSFSTSQYFSLDSGSVSVSSEHNTGTEETFELHNPNNGAPLAEGDGLSASLERLMINHMPCDLSGQVVIPDRGNPAQGGLADVHFGWFDKKEVAVKVLRIHKSRRADPSWEASNERRITREMHVWSALKHRNICEFLGYSMDFSDYPAMISTWCLRGTAYDYLGSQELSVRKRIRLALDVSEGLGYLHELNIIHGDLKPTNVLVDDTCVGRLCDFGLVRLVDWEGPAGMTTTSPYTGTERYKAPELFFSRDNRRPLATFEGDMYSLGCVMLEFIERLYPFERFAGAADLRDAIMDGHYPALRSETTRALLNMTDFFWELLETCWADPSSRPSIKEVVDTLRGYAHAMPPTS